MVDKKHLALSDLIKSVHQQLREDSKRCGAELAWSSHCRNKEKLSEYAAAMQDLAINHWDRKKNNNQKVVSRIIWLYEACKTYFNNIEEFRQRECYVFQTCIGKTENLETLPIKPISRGTKYTLLDVGSCYNPFSQFEIFDVTPIDIAAATTEVLICDFLNVPTGDNTIVKHRHLLQLQEDYYDIVVFSLLLEYFPNTEQRLKCCLKAYRLLRSDGILAIVTPDSNHVGSNTKIYKSWQCILAENGFIRVKYEKLPHLHCMLFRKALFPLVAKRWATVHKSKKFYKDMFIPQDFKEIDIK
ncbi:S-adenosylmethionine sensor upstream of mTORC1 [Euwallacea fornicatus]|uniref:S-adenosylmethionine sensor upstream of mTORC1 n=1 Tax=Euwallacea fornicatus TaxID=995702 RepID=UPI00338FA506